MVDHEMREFLSACGSEGPIVLGVEEPGTSGISWRVFDQPFIIVGRDPGADLFLNDPGVSRRHAYLQMIAGRLFCIDLKSRTGTRWGDETGLWGWVQPGMGVEIGPFRLRPREERRGESTSREAGESLLPVPVSRSFVQPELPEATVEILGAPDGSLTWRISRSLVLIGGSQACKVRLPGAGVAGVHASLLRTPSGIFAVDLLGPGGILVNGERVRFVRIGVDDEITVGTHRIRVRCTTPGALVGPLRVAGQRKSPGRPRIPARSAGGPMPPAKAKVGGTGEVLAPSGKGDDTAALVRSMLEEFGQIQLQMAGRFQESMMVLLRSFAGIHGEQMALIREELDRIRELTEEQQALRSRVEGRGAATVDPPTLRLVTGESQRDPRGQSSAAGIPQAPTRLDMPSPGLTIKGGCERTQDYDPAVSRAEESRPRPSGAPVPADLHAQIASRIAAIQDERQGRWQKLLKSLLG